MGSEDTLSPIKTYEDGVLAGIEKMAMAVCKTECIR